MALFFFLSRMMYLSKSNDGDQKLWKVQLKEQVL